MSITIPENILDCTFLKFFALLLNLNKYPEDLCSATLCVVYQLYHLQIVSFYNQRGYVCFSCHLDTRLNNLNLYITNTPFMYVCWTPAATTLASKFLITAPSPTIWSLLFMTASTLTLKAVFRRRGPMLQLLLYGIINVRVVWCLYSLISSQDWFNFCYCNPWLHHFILKNKLVSWEPHYPAISYLNFKLSFG